MSNAERWKHRRRMAYAALGAGLTYPLLLLATESDQLGAVAIPFYGMVTFVLTAYYGFATWDDNNFKDKQ